MAHREPSALTQIAAIIGPTHVLTGAADLEPHLVDWRGRYRGAAQALVRPGTTQEVAHVVRICAESGVPIVPQGGNTGLCGAATPDAAGSAIVLTLSRLNRVRGIDSDNATLTIEAGATLVQAQAAAAECGLLFPLSLASEGSCTIGGNLSTNAGGTAVLRFGNARELTLGLEVVLADGRVWDGLRALRKDNTGYDLKQLFIGAEGTLGIITAAVLKLFPASRTQTTVLAAVADVGAAIRLLTLVKRSLADRLVGFELMSGFSLALSRKHHSQPHPLPGHDWYALLQVSDPADNPALHAQVEQALAGAVDAGIVDDAIIGQSASQCDKLWALRENISEAQRREGPNVKHDISLPVSAIPPFLKDAESALSAALPGVRYVIFGHLGDGNLHYNLSAPEGQLAEPFMKQASVANRIVHDLVQAAGGSISAEHGIGQLKRDDMKRYKAPVALEMMARIKTALDPENLMNPGKVI